eukprot:SAG31_NODE_3579_length_4102_cov_3.565326_4_plen_176_part_00
MPPAQAVGPTTWQDPARPTLDELGAMVRCWDNKTATLTLEAEFAFANRDGISELPADIDQLGQTDYMRARGIKLISICLTGHEALKTLPPSIGKLTDVEALILSGCGLEALPDEICQLPNLKLLDLSDNFSLKRLPAEFEKLSLPAYHRPEDENGRRCGPPAGLKHDGCPAFHQS